MAPIVSNEYKEKKKRHILESALKAFGEKGFQLATIDDIVAESGLSKGAIYNYFKSKEEIYLQLMQKRTEENIAKLKNTFQESRNSKEKLHQFFNNYAEIELSQKWQRMIGVHLEFWIHSGRDEELKQVMTDRYDNVYQALLIEIIEEGIRQNEFKKETDPSLVSSMVWGTIDGICLHYSVIGGSYPYQKQIRSLEEMVFMYIEKGGSS
ncbi:TetR/AcrR family transcriptional regulator [Metabacillus idriensis]|uniref:TetR family transcriptional regulator n=1 Tax=Metabacillus idriensis TaxID=324768 RepID=A0A6I2MHC3_9BACI|nr:TetR/AcrR family transcriptional regulator [Metabacillus idriensis]MCM3598798.1 TetR/AcrR family transcriptional regulator [Metabacillus idriensis]MRX56532.1 TetR family transcriptional regulator [Metabacillus idriensis]